MDPSGLRRWAGVAGMVVACALPGRVKAGPALPGDPPAAAHDAGAWDLSFDKGNRRCRLFLRTEAVAGGYAVAMPAGCHKAFPSLAAVASWSPEPGERVAFKDAAGARTFAFAPDGTANLTAVASEGDIYSLMPVAPALQDALRAAGPAPGAEVPAGTAAAALDTAAGVSDGVLVERSSPTGRGLPKAAVPAANRPVFPPTTPAAVAGNYAVLRQDRDTGCMVTLDPGGRSGADLRAHLAPACRDQGIVVFDPSGWQLLHGNELVLSAKRGHTTALTRRDEKTWANAPPRGAALVLKRL